MLSIQDVDLSQRVETIIYLEMRLKSPVIISIIAAFSIRQFPLLEPQFLPLYPFFH